MANPQSSKGNPASKRMSNQALKDRRARSWKRGQDRKAQRIAFRKIAENENKVLRRNGTPTLWEKAKMKRWVARHPE